jgi:peroxiredoxin
MMSAGVAVAVILPQACTKIAASLETARKSYPFPIMCDEDRVVTKRYGVWHPIGLDAFNIAHPASFLIDARGAVRYTFVGRSQFARAPIDAILGAAERNDVR